MSEHVIVVDAEDRPLGVCEKLSAHVHGVRHRAVSVFIFDDAGRLVLQRRARGKYHCAGLWSNTCCGHPRPGESATAAAERRLWEEMAMSCPLRFAFTFNYEALVGGGLTENEVDHVFVGRVADDPHPHPDEVGAWHRLGADRVQAALTRRRDAFTPWFHLLAPYLPWLEQYASNRAHCM